MHISSIRYFLNNLRVALAITLATAAGITASHADGLPDPGTDIVNGCTALVGTDPQNDFFSPKGVTWGIVVRANGTVEHIDQSFAAAKAGNMPVFVSPHDHGRQFEGSGADWIKQYKRYKRYINDIALQLRKRGIHKVILTGMSANLCTESRTPELIEQGFEAMAVSDATTAAQLPGPDGDQAASVTFRMIASHVADTITVVTAIKTTSAN